MKIWILLSVLLALFFVGLLNAVAESVGIVRDCQVLTFKEFLSGMSVLLLVLFTCFFAGFLCSKKI